MTAVYVTAIVCAAALAAFWLWLRALPRADRWQEMERVLTTLETRAKQCETILVAFKHGSRHRARQVKTLRAPAGGGRAACRFDGRKTAERIFTRTAAERRTPYEMVAHRLVAFSEAADRGCLGFRWHMRQMRVISVVTVGDRTIHIALDR